MIEKASLGRNGPRVGRLGYGAMVLEGFYGETDNESALKTLCHAIESGMMIDTADALKVKLDTATLGRIDETAQPGLARGATLLSVSRSSRPSCGWR